MDKHFKNNGLSTIRPVPVDKCIKNCGLSMEFEEGTYGRGMSYQQSKALKNRIFVDK